MSVINFDQLPDSARVWIYAAECPLTENEAERLSQRMSPFMQQWTAHKRDLRSGWEMRYNQFILVAIDDTVTKPSGCSIDHLVHNLREFETETGCRFVGNSTNVYYRNGEGSIRCCGRAEFRELVATTAVDANTVVFNNVVATMAELRAGHWEVPMEQSWHMQAFAAPA